MNKLRPYYVICVIAGLVFVTSVLYLRSDRGIPPSHYEAMVEERIKFKSTCPEVFSKMFRKWLSSYRKCLVEQVPAQKRTYWKDLHVAIEKCLGDATWRMFDVHLLANWDDVKLVILPPNDAEWDKCTEVTLGVGNDVQAEQKLREIAPNCTFYGADPILASGKVFRELGTYFEIAVAAEAGILEASILEGGNYHSKNVSTVTLVDFLKNHAKVKEVDYLFMDNEGAEYALLWQFLRGGLLEKERLSICQLSVELHGPWKSYGVDGTTYENLVSALITNSSFLPLWSAAPAYHVRSFYLNVEDKYCVKKFLQSRFCLEP